MDEVTHPNMTDFEKELALHDYIVKTVEYDKSVLDSNELKKYIPENHSPYGPIILHKGVCEGYAKAMFVLLNKAGVQCEVVVGEGINSLGKSLGKGGHAWNIVKLDGEWYNLDVTWDDPGVNIDDSISYVYFNLTDEEIKRDHIRDERSLKEYPQCKGTKYSFINMSPDTNVKVSNKEELRKVLYDIVKNKKEIINIRFEGLKITMDELDKETWKIDGFPMKSSSYYMDGGYVKSIEYKFY
nr:transglutaminase domain-containing protein [Hathewaya massiliensis]